MSSGKVLLGLLAGFTAGTLLGMLFAPNTCGSESKKHFWCRDKGADETDERFNDFIEDVTEQFEHLKDEIVAGKSTDE